MTIRLVLSVLASFAALVCQPGRAYDDLRVSGFASLVAAKVIQGSAESAFVGLECPCFVADWSHGAVYGPHLQVKQESKAGVQVDYALNKALSATVQGVARGVDGLGAELEWAYLSYKIAPAWRLQVGRTRLPLFFYSDFQDIGYAYTWVRPPPDIYGWDVVNYNGGNLTYTGNWGGWGVRSTGFVGSETSKDNALQGRFATPDRIDVRWTGIQGANIELIRDDLTLRLNYNRMRVSEISQATGEDAVAPDNNRQALYGIAVNLDLDAWLIRSELGIFDRRRLVTVRRAMVGVGYQWKEWTPMLTLSSYSEKYDDPVNQEVASRWHTTSATLRYELTKTVALKAQLDVFKNPSPIIFNGSSRLISLSVDSVF